MPCLYHIRITLRKHSGISSELSSNSSAGLKFPRSLFDGLPSQSAAPISKRRDTLQTGNRKDYRFGPIRVDWIDFFTPVMSNTGETNDVKGQSEDWNTPAALFVPDNQPSSGTTNLPDGVVHIFRERIRNPMSGTGPPYSSSSTSHSMVSTSENSILSYGDADTTVAILAVPSWMTPSDFLAFVAPTAEGMKHLRLIRDVQPNRTMVVIQFREKSNAKEFIEEYNGKQFNSIEPETCNVVRVRSVEIDTDDPVSFEINRQSGSSPTLYELPTCPVCLDRMDSSATGLVTVPCSHTFHCMCLSKWGDSRCPVCRYSQTTLSSSSQTSVPGFSYAPPPAGSRLASCTECGSRLNLWICLICGNVGCGRQGRAHAKGHYDLTTHCFSMELATQRVWDYAGDNYVHRLIQNKADGKLVELPSASGLEMDMDSDETNASNQARGSRTGRGPGDNDDLKAEKVEVLAMQYSQILQRAMEDQRAVYDEQINDLQRRLEDSQRKMEILDSDAKIEAQKAREEVAQCRSEERERIEGLEREKVKAEKRAERMTELARRLEKDLKEERTVSEGLLLNVTSLKEKVDTMEKEKIELTSKVTDLQEQMRDLMFFLEARDKIEQGEGAVSEAAGGSIELPSPPPNRTTGNKKKKKR